MSEEQEVEAMPDPTDKDEREKRPQGNSPKPEDAKEE